MCPWGLKSVHSLRKTCPLVLHALTEVQQNCPAWFGGEWIGYKTKCVTEANHGLVLNIFLIQYILKS